jgi:hypothetical protein
MLLGLRKKVSKKQMLGKRTEIAQTAPRTQMWTQDKDEIRAHLSESCLQGLAKSAPKACQKLDKNS